MKSILDETGAVCQKQRGMRHPTPTREGSDKAKSIIIQASRQGSVLPEGVYHGPGPLIPLQQVPTVSG